MKSFWYGMLERTEVEKTLHLNLRAKEAWKEESSAHFCDVFAFIQLWSVFYWLIHKFDMMLWTVLLELMKESVNYNKAKLIRGHRKFSFALRPGFGDNSYVHVELQNGHSIKWIASQFTGYIYQSRTRNSSLNRMWIIFNTLKSQKHSRESNPAALHSTVHRRTRGSTCESFNPSP